MKTEKPCICDPSPFQCEADCLCVGCGCLKERPILFSASMVLAIIAGTKTQTRRIFKQRPRKDGAKLLPELLQKIGVGAACPYGKEGDRLWVRETHALLAEWAMPDGSVRFGPKQPQGSTQRVAYRAGPFAPGEVEDHRKGVIGFDFRHPVRVGRWRPSIHMPRWASRLTLEITGVRIERLQEISEKDATAEGFSPFTRDCKVPKYRALWESINGPGSWATNPWVWVIGFKRVTP